MTKSEYTEIIAAIGEIGEKVDNLKAKIDKREYLDGVVLDTQDLMNGNGKPGFKAIRDKVMSWESKFNTLSLLVAGDIIMQIYRAFSK